MEVQCPDGVVPGEMVSFQAPDGSWLEVAVPDGVAPGEHFSVEVEAPAERAAAEQQASAPLQRVARPSEGCELGELPLHARGDRSKDGAKDKLRNFTLHQAYMGAYSACVQLQGWRNHELRLKRLEPEMNFQESNGVQSSSLNLTLKHHQRMERAQLQIQSSHPELCGQQQLERATPGSIKPP